MDTQVADLRTRIRAIIDGPLDVTHGIRVDGTPYTHSRPTRSWCGCYEGDMDDSYPVAAAEVTELIAAEVEKELVELRAELLHEQWRFRYLSREGRIAQPWAETPEHMREQIREEARRELGPTR